MTRRKREHDRDPRPAMVTSSYPTWPMVMACAECGLWGARAYPYPMYEDQEEFEDPLSVTTGAMIGTLWCQRCSPWWGEYLLQQMTIRSLRMRGLSTSEPAMELLGGAPVDAIAFLESELADFFEGPGPLSTLRPHWLGDGPVAPKGDDFVWACTDLVAWMREARLVGFIQFATRQTGLAA